MTPKKKTGKPKSASRLSRWSAKAKLAASNALSKAKSLVTKPGQFLKKTATNPDEENKLAFGKKTKSNNKDVSLNTEKTTTTTPVVDATITSAVDATTTPVVDANEKKVTPPITDIKISDDSENTDPVMGEKLEDE